jgi:Outer membrane protein beta-barrel domain
MATRIASMAFTLALAAAPAHAVFEGAWLGVEAGQQNVAAGALVAGTDVLRQEGKTVATVMGGYRFGFGGRYVLGLDAGFGWIDGDLARAAPGGGSIEYLAKPQYQIGGMAGMELDLGGPTLLFAYLNETTRSFNVYVQQGAQRFQQQDEQGTLRYGVGLERAMGESLAVRVTVGSSRADYGDRRTDIDGDKAIDVMVGLVWRFR